MDRYSATQSSSTAWFGSLYVSLPSFFSLSNQSLLTSPPQQLQLGPNIVVEYWLNGTAYYSGPPPHLNQAFQNAMLRAYKAEDQADDLNNILLFYPGMTLGYDPGEGYPLGSMKPPKDLY